MERCVAEGASDIHISADMPPVFRIHGTLRNGEDAPFTANQVRDIAHAAMSERQLQSFHKNKTLDLGLTANGERFRVNVYLERGNTAIAVRHLDNRFQTLEALHLPAGLKTLAQLDSGLVLVSGATGSGKSTTLAALIHEINETRNCHIITVEDPVEFIHKNKLSLIHQREVFTDTHDFASAVRASLREDPDVIMVGEMRDLETMRAAITAAETGHLVFSTLHTGDAVGVVERLVGAFPPEEQSTIRHRLAQVLHSVFAQHLLPRLDGAGRVPAVEIMIVNKAVSHMIESGRSKQIYSTIETSRGEGMQTLDQALVQLVGKKLVSLEIARRQSQDTQTFDTLHQHVSKG